MTEIRTPSDAVGQRINELRKKRGWSLKRLAEECAKVGGERLTVNALENIEYGRPDKDGRRRREITVDELLIFAYVLDVAPVHLLVPITEMDYPYVPKERMDHERSWIVGTLTGWVREWIRGNRPMPATDARLYFSEVPEAEWLAAAERQGKWPEMPKKGDDERPS